MRRGVPIRRYARALITIAAEQGQLDSLGVELSTFASLLRGNGELSAFFRNPGFPLQEKGRIFETIAERMKLGPIARSFFTLLLERQELFALETLVRAYEELKDEYLGRLKGVVTSAVPLNPEETERLRERLQELIGKPVYLELRVDPSLLGGLVVRLKSTVYDGSLKLQLQKMREQLLTT